MSQPEAQPLHEADIMWKFQVVKVCVCTQGDNIGFMYMTCLTIIFVSPTFVFAIAGFIVAASVHAMTQDRSVSVCRQALYIYCRRSHLLFATLQTSCP